MSLWSFVYLCPSSRALNISCILFVCTNACLEIVIIFCTSEFQSTLTMKLAGLVLLSINGQRQPQLVIIWVFMLMGDKGVLKLQLARYETFSPEFRGVQMQLFFDCFGKQFCGYEKPFYVLHCCKLRPLINIK